MSYVSITKHRYSSRPKKPNTEKYEYTLNCAKCNPFNYDINIHTSIFT